MNVTFLIIAISGTLITFGLFLYLIVIYEKKRQKIFIANAVETEGIAEGVTFGFHFTYPSFFLKYSYHDNYRTKYENSTAIGIQAFKYKKGEKITVYYDSTNPSNSMIKIT
jgi:hypothetical protein